MTTNIPKNRPLLCPDSHSLLGAWTILTVCFAATSANLSLQRWESNICKAREPQQMLRESSKTGISEIIICSVVAGSVPEEDPCLSKALGASRGGRRSWPGDVLCMCLKITQRSQACQEDITLVSCLLTRETRARNTWHTAGLLFSHHIFLALLFYSSPFTYLFFPLTRALYLH